MALVTSKSRVKPIFSAVRKQEEAKRSRQEELDDLCAVGYACKLFRDDARARDIDRGDHLIPWMGDKTLMIDRYDGRGHLHDLKEFEQVGWKEESDLSAEAARIEAICDEERYMALHMDLLEVQTRQDEELKRLNEAITSDKGYTSVEFNYGAGNEDYDPMQPTEDETEAAQHKLVSHDNQPPPSYQNEDSTPAADLEEPFVAPPELNLPPGMEQPQTLKMHVIIEKTAMFVCNHGPQMEIIVKTKQANNPQFDFIQFDHFLNPYYKHLVRAIKSKSYIPLAQRSGDQLEKKKQGEVSSRRSSNSNSVQSDDDEEGDMEGSGYLHPSLFAPPRPKPAAVQMLPNPRQGAPLPDHIPPHLGLHQGEMFPVMEMQQQQQHLLGYYEVMPVATATPFPMPPMLAPPPPPPDHTNSGTPVQLGHPLRPPPPGFLPGEHIPGAVLPHHHPALVPPPHEVQPLPLNTPASVLGPPLISQEVPAAAEESAIEPQRPLIVPPPPDVQPIIDKLAKYVAKNGDEFEASVRAKCDPRFEFLVPWHSYNAYYLAKKQMFVLEFNQGLEEGEAESQNATEKPKKVPVRFPIKPKRAEERTLGRRSALPLESSSDSEDLEEADQTTTSDSHPTKARMTAGPPPGYRGLQPKLMAVRPQDGKSEEGEWASQLPATVRGVNDDLGESEQCGGGGIGDAQRQLQQLHDGGEELREYDEVEEEVQHIESRLAEDGKEFSRSSGNHQRLEDRLAMAARKKLATASQERSLQVERRKKLALFLSQVKDRPQAAAAAQEGGLTDPEREEADGNVLLGKLQPLAGSHRISRPESPHIIRGAHSESRGSKRAPSVPKSYQTAVNRAALDRDRKRKGISPSGCPSPRQAKRKSPSPHPPVGAGASVIGSASSASPMLEPCRDRDPSVSSPSDESESKQDSLPSIQPSAVESRTESKAGGNDLRAKIRKMLAAAMKEEIG